MYKIESLLGVQGKKLHFTVTVFFLHKSQGLTTQKISKVHALLYLKITEPYG